ncbi:MAG: hypothetical protein QMD71_03010 [bacterium]|nr:hypothetical protein [bacterium]
MKRVATATVAFYVGILSLLLSVISGAFGVRLVGVRPISFVHFANVWFLIALISLLHEISKKLGEKK